MSEARSYSYGSDPDQTAELLLAGGDGHQPIAVLLHGGFWRARHTRTLMDPMAVDLAKRGWASWNVEYRRGAGRGITALNDIDAAIALLRGLEAPVDLARLVVVGHSAGGHLALLAGATAQASLIVSLAGVSNLMRAAADHLGDDAPAEFIGATADEAPGEYELLNPTSRLPIHTRVLLVHGDLDREVPISQSRDYLAAAQEAGDDCELLELPGVDHMSVIDPRSAAFGAWAERLSSVA